MVQHGVQQVLSVSNVVAVVAGWLAHGFAHLAECGKVHDRVDLVFTKDPVQQALVGQVSLDELAITGGVAEAGGERLSRMSTSCPLWASILAMCEPMYPAPPTTRTRASK